eukprot:Ihof_evm8s71 gene=Ihof_evmTU8s71
MSMETNNWRMLPYDPERRMLQYRGGEAGLAEGWTVILSNELERRLVVYNAERRQVTVKATPPTSTESLAKLAPTICPLCNSQLDPLRPAEAPRTARRKSLPNYTEERGGGSGSEAFVDPHYFKLLASTLHTQNLGHSLAFHPTEAEQEGIRTTRASSKQNNDKPPPNKGLSDQSMIDGYYERFFQEVRKIGSGLRGQVFLCRHVIEGEILGEFAVKKIPVGNNHLWFVSMLTEVHMLEKLHHPNVLDYKHAWLEHAQLAMFGPKVPCLFLLIEYANSGNLAQYMWAPPASTPDPSSNLSRAARKKREFQQKASERAQGTQEETNPDMSRIPGRYLDQEEVISLMQDFLLGLGHLHRHNIIHRDLKPQNLLLHRYTPHQRYLNLLVSDFGECEMLAAVGSRHRSGHTGTIEYMAPELLEQDEEGNYSEVYDMKSDMWSAGLILHVLMFGQLPWKSSLDDFEGIKAEILAFRQVEIPPLLEGQQPRSAGLLRLLEQMLQHTPGDRPTYGVALMALQDLQQVYRTDSQETHPASETTSHIQTTVDGAPTYKPVTIRNRAESLQVPGGVVGNPRVPALLAPPHPVDSVWQPPQHLVLIYTAAVFAKTAVVNSLLQGQLPVGVLNLLLLVALGDLLLLSQRQYRVISGALQAFLLLSCWPQGHPTIDLSLLLTLPFSLTGWLWM